MNAIDLLGHLGALVIIATYSMKTMIPLRVAGIAGSCIFITYGYLSSTWPVLMLHLVVLLFYLTDAATGSRLHTGRVVCAPQCDAQPAAALPV